MTHKKSPTKELHMAIMGLARELDTATTKFLKVNGLTPTRYEIMEELLTHHPEGRSQATLARDLHMQPANILMALRPLIKMGWVTHTSLEHNRKEKPIVMTPKGLEEFSLALDRYYRAMDKVYSDPPPESLMEWIRRLRIRVNS
ncbi:MAG: MarR family winged helix-turn-helix transcriptional regulator [Planctomycetota bacterium]